MELPVSVPRATRDKLAATAAELPPLDPAHMQTTIYVHIICAYEDLTLVALVFPVFVES